MLYMTTTTHAHRHYAILAGQVIATLLIAAVCGGSALLFYSSSNTVAPVASTTPAQGCWFEKAATLDTAELICGDTTLRPTTDTADTAQLQQNEVPAAVWAWAQAHTDAPSVNGALQVPVGTAFGPAAQQWTVTADGSAEPVGAN